MYVKGSQVKILSDEMKEYVAKWLLNRSAIILNVNGATTGSNATIYAEYDSSTLYSGATGATTASITNPSNIGYSFGGWTATQGGSDVVIDTNGALVASVSDYTDANGKWIRTDNATLYAKWVENNFLTTANNEILIDSNGKYLLFGEGE